MNDMINSMSEMCCKRCGASENRIHGFCSVECEEYYSLEEEIGALDRVIIERGVEIFNLKSRIAELEGLVDRLIEIGDRLVFPDGVFDDEQSVIERDWRILTKAIKEYKNGTI